MTINTYKLAWKNENRAASIYGQIINKTDQFQSEDDFRRK